MREELTKELEDELNTEISTSAYNFDRVKHLVNDVKRFVELVEDIAQESPHSQKVIELRNIVQALNLEQLAKNLENHLDTENYLLIGLGLAHWKDKFSGIKRFIEETNELVLFTGRIYTLDSYDEMYLKALDRFAVYKKLDDPEEETNDLEK
jgi:hypothetical protein